MSWCPKCKNEYRSGIEICPDCNEALVEELTESMELEFIRLFHTAEEEAKTKLVKYLIHCGHKVQEDSEVMDTEEGPQTFYVIYVPKEDFNEASKEIRTALIYDAKQEAGEEALKPRRRAPEPSTVYVDAKARYQEYKSSGIMFLVFAALFLVFGILNIVGVINIMASTPSLIIVFGAVVGFAYVGITSLMKVSSLKEEASTEETTTEMIMAYLKEQFPKEVLEKMETAELSGELLYFEQMETMKEHLISEFPDKDENYLDALLEEYYNSLEI